MTNTTTPYRRVVQAAWIACAATVTAMAQAQPVPSSLVPPQQTQPVLTTTASGVQIYSCEYGNGHSLAWVFKSPLATLYDASGREVIKHSAGPSWQAEDNSRIVGRVLAQAPSETAQSIPQLLLQVVVATGDGDGLLTHVRYVQRLDTVGGLMPTQACKTEHQLGSSPYLARYVFLK
jgi:hypothetical protein